MTRICKRLSFVFTIAIGLVHAGCGGPQQTGQTAFPLLRDDPASTPLPNRVVSHPTSRSLPHSAISGRPLLYLGDSGGSDVDIYPLTGPNQKQIGSITSGIVYPWGLSLAADGSVYVADASNGTVTVYPYGSSSPSMTYSKGLHQPLYALADSAGHVYVGDREPAAHNKGFIVEYGAGANFPIKKVRLGSEEDGMAFDANGNLYVAYRKTAYNSSIAKFGPGLTNKRLLGMTINQPQGLVVDSSGNIVVVESASDDIKVFPPGTTTPSVTLNLSTAYRRSLAQLAMQNSETTLWVSTEGGEVLSMPYPLTASTKAAEYEQGKVFSNGIAVTH